LRGARVRRAALGMVPAVAGLAFGAAQARAQSGTVDFTANQQQVEGFGFSQAFGASQSVSYLSQNLQNQVWDLMFNPKTGLGMDVLRIGFNTGYNIEPNSPGAPGATPTYQWDGSDGKQVQTAQIAQRYGVNDFFAVSWSAPGYMKTNGNPNDGGALCGVSGTLGAGITNSCNGQDWQQAYANYLVQYVNDYKSAGVPISGLGVQNEPDFTAASYQSMTFTPAQIAGFVNTAFGPTVRSQLPGVRTMCCDSNSWYGEFYYTGTLPYYAPFNSYVDISTAHEYGSTAVTPQPFTAATTKPSWMTEWATLSTTDELRWDAGGTGDSDGMYLANDLITAFNAGNVNEYTYWWGAINSANALVEVYIGNFAGYYQIPGRYYAMAALSRYVKPGAYRVATTNTNSNLNVVAFRNTDGSKVLEILNKGTAATTGSFTVDAGTGATGGVKTLLTDQTDSLNETDSAVVAGTQLSVPLPPRSLTTVLLPPTKTAGSVQLVLTSTVTKLGDGSYEAAVKITNNGTGTVQGLMLATGSLGSAQGAPTPLSGLPEVAGTGAIAPGGYTIVPLNYAASAGGSGSTVVQKYSGTYTGGSFNSTLRTVLP
jgi:O-glycosyl hydrolase